MAFSSDEGVLKMVDKYIRKLYANSLLSLAAKKHISNGRPFVFGERNVKGRVKNIMNNKKPKFWVLIMVIVAVIGVGIGLKLYPVKKSGKGTYSIVYLNPVFSVTGEAFANARHQNVYQFEEDMFKITSKIEGENISIINPIYEEERVGNHINVVGGTLDVSKYSHKRCFHVLTPEGIDTGYVIYEMDDEVWISRWGWYGESKNVRWCDYILRIQ